MLLGNLVKFVDKKYGKIPVNGISFDSRKVKKGDIFFAIRGTKTSGNKFIKNAILKGASTIITEEKRKFNKYKIPILFTKDAREKLSEACSNFYKTKKINLIAVTGTNGKSSVADFYYQILSLNKIPVASIGTLGIISKNYKKKTNLTSIDPLSLHKTLKILYKKNTKNIILEASSHGLAQKRLNHLNISTGIFTNFSHDHLDYHKTTKAYFNSKMYLFKNLLKKNSKIITDKENKEFKVIKKISRKKKIKMFTIGEAPGKITIISNRYNGSEQIVKILVNSKVYLLKVPLIGYYQIKNLLMAILAALISGVDSKKIFSKINKIKPVPGRLELIKKLPNNSHIILDFAHTPDALEQSLIALKKQFNKKIIIVFGCGGERDKKKRFKMGKIAKKYCSKIIITDDNPRGENPKKIRNEIIKGSGAKTINIGNRKKAITTAIEQLQPNQILLVAGKGHETIQTYGKKVFNFSDKKAIKEVIYKKKSKHKKFNYKNFLLKENFNGNLKNINFNGVSINTKSIKKNDLFFAIKGKKTDGHLFVKDAIKKGAIISIVSRKIKKVPKHKIIKVNNTFSSLNNFARVTRDNTDAKIIGITGSVGKTTLKNLIGFALKKYGLVYQSPLSYNNKFGVPISLSNLKKNTEYGVFEIGMDKKGEINNLSKIVKPEIAIITNISEAHIKNFKNLKDIAKAKAEIINNISIGGSIILNKDGKFFNFFSNLAIKRKINVISFSVNKKADITLSGVRKIKNQYKLKIFIKNKFFYFYTKHATDNFISNVLACVSVLFSLNLDLNKIQKKFNNFSIPDGRGDIKIVKKFNKRFKFIDESYNANPLSMSSAIKNMNQYKKQKNIKKFVLLGDMLDLGRKSKKLHKEISPLINKSDIDKVYVYGKHIRETFNFLSKNKKGKVFNSLKEASDHFSKILHNNDLLMVKGSNATGLNKFSKNFKKEQTSVI
tara:strand:- start:6085 stop:8931 length:2847 start_codon:yes stop_codon:yes gene_type:complete